MSMLAERKRKQKWSLNPRGKHWALDSNKFGQKMLEKMGWSQGKGLGAKENGITEHVKLSYKNDNKGMGYKDTNDQWTEHETNFSALLESLTGTESKIEEVKLNSLEKKSQLSRARVHYHKFTRGKDLSRCSEKDLANIFGKRSLKKPIEISKVEEIGDTKNDSDEITSQFTYNGGLISDYFKKKIPNFGKINGYVVGNNGVLKKDDSELESELNNIAEFKAQRDEDEVMVYKGFGYMEYESQEKNENQNDRKKQKQQPSFVSYVSENKTDEEINSEERTKKKKHKLEDSDQLHANKKLKLEKTKKDKHNRKLSTKIEENIGLSNPAFNPMHTPVKVEKHFLDTIEECVTEYEESQESIVEDNAPIEVSVQINNETTPKTKKKTKSLQEATCFEDETNLSKKKKKKRKKCEDNIDQIEVFNSEAVIYDETESSTPKMELLEARTNNSIDEIGNIEVAQEKVKMKKKKSKNINGSEVENQHDLENFYEVKIKEKKKKKKKRTSKEDNCGADNPVFNSDFSYTQDIISEESGISQIVENPYEIKVKKNKKKKTPSIDIDNPHFGSFDSDINRSVVNEDCEVKRKKKLKNRNKENGLDNPAINLSTSFHSFDSDVNQSAVNQDFEVKRKKEKSKKGVEEIGLDNPALNLSNTTDPIENCDLILNVISTPVTQVENHIDHGFKKTETNSVKRRKSVRFSNVTQELIIPNNRELEQTEENDSRNELFDTNGMDISNVETKMKKGKKRKTGIDNTAFDKYGNNLEENINSISKTLDQFQAEIENDINEEKLKTVEISDMMVGEVGNLDGDNERLQDGSTKLKFKHAKFGKTPGYIEGLTGSRKSYKHLIKGDIVLKFKESNMHEIKGYAGGHITDLC